MSKNYFLNANSLQFAILTLLERETYSKATPDQPTHRVSGYDVTRILHASGIVFSHQQVYRELSTLTKGSGMPRYLSVVEEEQEGKPNKYMYGLINRNYICDPTVTRLDVLLEFGNAAMLSKRIEANECKLAQSLLDIERRRKNLDGLGDQTTSSLRSRYNTVAYTDSGLEYLKAQCEFENTLLRRALNSDI